MGGCSFFRLKWHVFDGALFSVSNDPAALIFLKLSEDRIPFQDGLFPELQWALLYLVTTHELADGLENSE